MKLKSETKALIRKSVLRKRNPRKNQELIYIHNLKVKVEEKSRKNHSKKNKLIVKVEKMIEVEVEVKNDLVKVILKASQLI